MKFNQIIDKYPIHYVMPELSVPQVISSKDLPKKLTKLKNFSPNAL